MQKRFFSDGVFNYVRVSKRTAKTIYRAGLDVVFCPVNLRPFTGWNYQTSINAHDCNGEQFETVLNAYEFYNCNNSETGKYTAFYMPCIKTDLINTGADFFHSYDYEYMNQF